MGFQERTQDEVLVLRCQEGDATALDELLGRWQERLWRHARRLTGDEEAAWDILQETCMAVARDIRRLSEVSAFPAWIYRIASNKCRDWIRRQVRQRRWEDLYAEDAQLQSEEQADLRQKVADLKEAMSQLAGPDRALLSMRYEEDFSLAEIAAILMLPEGTIKSRLHYAKQRLRILMEVKEDE